MKRGIGQLSQISPLSVIVQEASPLYPDLTPKQIFKVVSIMLTITCQTDKVRILGVTKW